MTITTVSTMQQRIRIIAGQGTIAYGCALPNGGTGAIVGMLPISPGWYAVVLDTTKTRCIVSAINLEALALPRGSFPATSS